MIRVADYVMKRLSEQGIKDLFYVPGGQCVFLMDALRRNENIRGIGMHHEQAVAMAALSYASYNENFGAGLVTTGCAGTNTYTGILHAYQDSIPMIIVSGQQSYEHTIKYSGLPLRQVGVQEADIETIMRPVTKYAVTVDVADSIAWHLDKAFWMAKEGRPGPVWVDLPLNVQNAMVDEDSLLRFIPTQNEIPRASKCELDYVSELLCRAKRPVLLIGNGVRLSHAHNEFIKFAHRIGIPVVLSKLATDLMAFDDKCNFGVLGGAAGANRYANFIVQNSDLVISVGSRLSIEVTGPSRNEFAREAVKVVVDIDPIEHKKAGINIDRFIHSDAKKFFEDLLDLDLPETSREWVSKCNHWKEIFDYEFETRSSRSTELIDMKLFMTEFSRLAPKGVTYVADAGLTGAAAPAVTHMKDTDRFVLSLAQAEMGYSLPGACGIAPLTDKPVVAYTGDGSIMMNLQELQTVVRNGFNIKIVIINNNGYSGVRHGQKAHFRGKSIGTDPSNGLDLPSYEKIAWAFGIAYQRIDKFCDIEKSVKTVFAENKPYILEVFTDPEQFDLHNGLVMYGKRKFGFRPIEDQSPYIERELFYKEMIVEPLETSSGKPV